MVHRSMVLFGGGRGVAAHRICSRNRNGDGRSVEAADLTQVVVVTLTEAW